METMEQVREYIQDKAGQSSTLRLLTDGYLHFCPSESEPKFNIQGEESYTEIESVLSGILEHRAQSHPVLITIFYVS